MDGRRRTNLIAYAALATGIVCIGFSAIFVKLAGVSGTASAFYRVLIAGLVVVPWGVWRYDRRRRPTPRNLALAVAAGLVFGLELALWNTSLLYTSATTSTLLANNASLWVGLAALLLFREQLSARYWCGLLLALAGMSVLVGVTAWSGFRLNFGDLLAILASFLYAAYLLLAGRARAGIDTLTFMAASLVPSIVLLFGMSLAMGAPLTGYSRRSWLALIGLGLISHMVGWLSLNYALGHLRAALVSVSLLAQSVVTAVASLLVLGEPLRMRQVVGGIVVLAGIYLANQRSRRPAAETPVAS